MTSFSSLRVRLVGTILLAITPAWVLMFITKVPWTGFVVGLLALGAAWFGGEQFILRQIRVLSRAAQRWKEGDLGSRTGLTREPGEIGDLARAFDVMAEALQERILEREQAEKTLLNRSFQQTVVGALGQFAMVSHDFSALLNQVVMLVAQTLEVEFCNVLELLPDGRSMVLRSGVGWREGQVGKAKVPADPATQAGFTLTAGEPVVVDSLSRETRFRAAPLLVEHSVTSGMTVAIAGHGQAFGILGAYTTRLRKFTEDEVHFLLSIATVLAMAVERNRAEAEMQKLAAFAQLNPNPAMELGTDGKITYFNDAALKLAISSGHATPVGILPPNVGEIIRTCLASRQSVRHLQTQMAGRTLSWSLHPVMASKVVHCYVEDITERLNLEAQLRQAQKMESVGQLAAGVAHDFNNMLTVIQGHSGLLMSRQGLPREVLESGQAIFFAAERAASLTRQLLMFSRKSLMQPQPLDLRDTVGNMSKMLKRLLGETITLEFTPPAEVPLVQADASMVEQVLMNLAVNARDAMDHGGALTISLSQIQTDEVYVHAHPEARVGSYVCLRISDTGHGMDAQTRARIFEPFFTTKEVGKGTGLGLATVYGIVKQHEGWILVDSEPGQGATFDVFWRACTGPVKARQTEVTTAPEVCGGNETILLVEDEPVLRDMAHILLQECGYRVLEAATGVEAIQAWERYSGPVDLLLTDMVMPGGMSGMELAQKLLVSKPKLRVVFTSGYSVNELDTDFIHRGGAVFLQKPYTRATLTKAVRECLDKR
jgi:signal transduction histidine kinase/CheY-like chemotaxis protein